MVIAADSGLRAGIASAAAPCQDPACALLDQAQVALFLVQDGVLRFANRALADLLGWPVAELLGRRHEIIVSPEQRAQARALLRLRPDGVAAPGEALRCLRRDQSAFDARVFARKAEFGARPAVLVTLFDIGEQLDARRDAERHAAMLTRTEALCRTGSFEVELPSGRVVLSQGLRVLLGLDGLPAADAQIDALDWVPPEERAYVAAIWRNAAPDTAFEFQHRVLAPGGRRLEVLHRAQMTSADAQGSRGVAILQDITVLREAESRIHELANFDEVTGLPNRKAFLERVDEAVHSARWDGRRFVLVALDVALIDEIKASMGFGAGDALAMALAARLMRQCAENETAAHIGGSEFALLLNAPAGDTGQDAVLARARAIQSALQAPERLGQADVLPLAVLGLAAFPGDGEQAARLLENAQAARLAAASNEGIAFFKPEANASALRELRMASALRLAIERNELSLHYQPQVELGTGTVCGAEALLRWQSPEFGSVSPAEFIPAAERSGLIDSIGEWVLRQVCLQSLAWTRAGLPPLRVAVNLSAAQLAHDDLARRIQAVLLETGADPQCLGIELTESMVMSDAVRTAAVLRQIKAIGIEISLDDFGTGFSSLSSLRSLPIDVVKVDRSFVHDVTAATQDVSVTRAIITMAHSLQMQVLAEGVETEGQLSLLQANGCDMIQGFWFSRPLPAGEFEQLLRDKKQLPERFVNRAHKKRTLLLVDDEENIVSALKRLFRRDGYHLVTAYSAAEGLQRLAETPVDVIVSDQRMPGMTGVEFLRRAKELYPDTVRMVLSGYTELQSIIDAVNEGAIYKFLTKPWDDERLRQHVAEAFCQKEMADENRRLAREVATANAGLAELNQRLERLVVDQREQALLLEASSGGMRDVLDELPAPVLGVDPEGLVAYVNCEAQRVLVQSGVLLGSLAHEVLPVELQALLHGGDGLAQHVVLGGCRYRALCRPISPNDPDARGRLLVLLPEAAMEVA